jgi:hypothetical protein
MSLPNLSRLYIATEQDFEADEKPSKAARIGPKRARVMDVGWRQLFNESDYEYLKLKVIKVQANGSSLTANFVLKDQTMTLPGKEKDCVELEFDSEMEVLTVSNLFVNVPPPSKERAFCQVTPLLPNTGGGGYGNMVLTLADCLAAKLPALLSLYDMSHFGANVKPAVSSGGMTKTLCLTRGFGFYEARGWFSENRMQNSRFKLPEFPKVSTKDAIKYFRLAQDADLMWTAMITTTPVKHLFDAIVAFPSDIRDMLGNEEVRYLTENYSEEYCQKHAEHAQRNFLDDFLHFLSGQDLIAGQTVAWKLQDLSLRQLATTSLDPKKLTEWMTIAFERVWPRFTINRTGMFDKDTAYPGSNLIKLTFRISGNVYGLVCKSDPNKVNSVPVSSIEPIRTDLEIEFM